MIPRAGSWPSASRVRCGSLALLPFLLLGLAGAAPLEAPVPWAEPGVAALDAGRILGPPRGRPLGGQALLDKTQSVATKLRCPVCQGLSVADSPETLAENMRTQVRDLLSQGYSQDQVLAYFEAAYGEFVLLEPKLEGINWLVWLAPAAVLLIGAGAVARSLKRLTGGAARQVGAAPGDPETVAEADDELLAYLQETRRLAYGDTRSGESGDA